MADAHQIASDVRERMLTHDAATNALGIRIEAIGPGTARAAMTVRADMLNGFAICHGGFIATLADSAFAFACNSRNDLTVASGFGIDIVAPGKLGDELTAAAEEVSLTGRTGVYDVTVRNQRGELIAEFRGRSYRLKGRQVLKEPQA